ncbi:MAG: hypothetical protein GXW85_07985 [Clostridia bacterium]|nr:hypothetical protein [Clostridia bacterium]
MRETGVTGEKVKISGEYRNKYGKKVTLEAGKNFPPCPEKGIPTSWEKI